MKDENKNAETHKVKLDMKIYEFKQYLLAINDCKPFFLEFNMDNYYQTLG